MFLDILRFGVEKKTGICLGKPFLKNIDFRNPLEKPVLSLDSSKNEDAFIFYSSFFSKGSFVDT